MGKKHITVKQNGITVQYNAYNTPPTLPPEERVTVAEVESTIKCLRNMKTLGLDGIFNICIKNLQNRAMTQLSLTQHLPASMEAH